MLHNSAVLGTGVLKGPIVTNRTRKAWQPYTDLDGNQVHTMEIVEELRPASFSVDPGNVWPDPLALAISANAQHSPHRLVRNASSTEAVVRVLKHQRVKPA